MGHQEKPVGMPGFGAGVNWDAIGHQQLWDWLAQPSLDGMESSARSWTETVAGRFRAAADRVDEALRMSGVHWQGAAADAMRSGVAPLAEHALGAREAATLVGETTGAAARHRA